MTSKAWAGGGDFDSRQMIQQKTLEEGYRNIAPLHVETVEEVVEEWKPDYIDNMYIGMRTYVPSWLMLLCGFIGAVVIVTFTFRQQLAKFLKFLGVILEIKK